MLSSNKNLASFSPNSQGWLTAALDPYHDYQYAVNGLPDERSAPSVVQIHNQTITIAAPASAAAGNFDASVIYTGFNSQIGNPNRNMTQPWSAQHEYDSTALSAGRPTGALDIWAGAAGSALTVGAPIAVGDVYAALGSVLSTDRCRLIAVGFEVHNTTAAINRQGSLTVAQLPDVGTDCSTVVYVDTAAAPIPHYYTQADRGAVIASTVAPLLAVPGSQTWMAEEGVYAVPRMTLVPRDLVFYEANGFAGRTTISYDTGGHTATPEPVGIRVDGTNTYPVFNASAPSGFSPLQVFFTGLSNASTLTVTFRTVVEYFPALASPLLPLAEPSPIYDPAVLGLYSAVITEAPYAVPVGQNSAGDYLRKVAHVISEALSITSPMFGSFAPLVKIAAELGKKFSSPKDKASKPPAKVRKDEAGASAMQSRAKTNRSK